MTTHEGNTTDIQEEGPRDEPVVEPGDEANAAEKAGPEIITKEASAIGVGVQEEGQEQEDTYKYCDDESDGDIPFEPFDINNDGRIVKTASQCSRGSWKRPEAGWDVTITVHRFCELSLPKGVTGEGAVAADGHESSSQPRVVSQVDPEFLQLEFRLGEDENEGFPQETADEAKAAGVNLHPLLHCGIETMGRNERATFVVTDGFGNSAEKKEADSNTTTEVPPQRRFEYDISLDDWTEEIDLSERQDSSLVKRVIRDGDAVTRPVDIGGVTVRCRVVRMPIAQERREQEGDGEEPPVGEVVVFDNLQSQNEDDHDQANDEEGGLEAPLSFVLDDCPFGSGVMTVLKSMSKGEQCEAWLDPKHGPVDHEDDGNFYHQVVLELVDVEELPPVFADEDIRLEMSSRFKSEGNEKFTAGDYDRALRRYEKAIKYADGVPPGEPSDEGEDSETSSSGMMQANDRESELENADGNDKGNDDGDGKQGEAFTNLQVAVLCNQAACFLKLGDGPSALEAANRASSLKAVSVDSPAGIKAAYRRACALEAVGEWDEARDAFKSVLAVAPKNSQCRQGIARLSRAKKDYEARLRKTFGGCLVSNKLKGFASEGREVPESSLARPGGDAEDQEGAWNKESESETDSGDDASSSSSSDEEEEDEDEDEREKRVEALYKVATGGGSSGGEEAPLVNADTATAVDNTTAAETLKTSQPETEPAVTTTAAVAAAVQGESRVMAAPCSEPAAAPAHAPEVIPISSLKTLAKEFEVVDPPLKEPSQPDVDVNRCSQAEASKDDLAASVVPPS